MSQREEGVSGALRALSVSLMLTMRLFQALPEPVPRPRIAMVRMSASGGGFDPREILPNGAILTMPYRTAGSTPHNADPAGHQPTFNKQADGMSVN